MKIVIITVIALVLLIPLSIFAQEEFGVSSDGGLDDFFSTIESKYSMFVSVVALVISIIAVFLAVSIFTIQQIQGKKLKNMIKELHTFVDEENYTRSKKRARYSRGILFTLRLIDYEIESIVSDIEFFKVNRIDKTELDKRAESKYERIQGLFIDMKLEYDTILEVFDHETEHLYSSAFKHIRVEVNIWKYILQDTKQLEKAVLDIDVDFKKLKDILITFTPDESKSNFKDLFEQQKRDEVKSKIQSFSEDNNPQDSEP